MSKVKIERLKEVKDFDGLIVYLKDELGWPIEVEDTKDITFDYDSKELGIEEKYAANINIIKQIRPLVDSQPWGLFYIEFETKYLPVVVLRRILRALIYNRRTASDRMKTWDLTDLIFISTLGEEIERKISFAHFSQSEGGLPILKTFSWDPTDTYFHFLQTKLDLEKLSWPDDVKDVQFWRDKWSSAFKLKHREVIRSAKQLAIHMAHLAARIREQVKFIFKYEVEDGPLHKLYNNFKKVLIHDLEIDKFADMYSQTIAYGLFSAKASYGAKLLIEDVTKIIPDSNPFLKNLFAECTKFGEDHLDRIDLEELGIRELIDLLDESNIEAVLNDFGKQKKGEDPVIHFYELFLREYDPTQKIKMGVFYTPDPVVSFMVRSVNYLLKNKFYCENGLAEISKIAIDGKNSSKNQKSFFKVQILDPATGTGTFLKHIIKEIKIDYDKRYKSLDPNILNKNWNKYVVDLLLPRLFGFEIMMAPYAVAHLKLALELKETGYNFSQDKRLGIYLSNTLEDPYKETSTLEKYLNWLAEESMEATKIKNSPILVVIGNPPYSISSQNIMDWITKKTDEYVEESLLNREKGKPKIKGISGLKSMKDDYIKFIRFAQWLVTEKNQQGIIAFITNGFYIDGLSARGIRKVLRTVFDEIWIIDFHGNVEKGIPEHIKEIGIIKDENLFEGVGRSIVISFFIRYPKEKHDENKGLNKEGRYSKSLNCLVKYYEKWGLRENYKDKQGNIIEGKYEFLRKNTISSLNFVSIGDRLDHEFTPSRYESHIVGEFDNFPYVCQIFLRNAVGMVTGHDFEILGYDKDDVKNKLDILFNHYLSSYDDLPIKTTKTWNPRKIKKTNLKESVNSIFPLMYRGFDRRYVPYNDGLIGRHIYKIMQYLLPHQNNVAIALARVSRKASGATSVFMIDNLMESHFIEGGSGIGDYFFPLRINNSTEPDDFKNPKPAKDSNINSNFKLLLPYKIKDEIIFYYIYGILNCNSYRERYRIKLKIDFPRIPFPIKINLIEEMAKMGKLLSELHLLNSDLLSTDDTSINISKNTEQGRRIIKPFYDNKSRIYFIKPKKEKEDEIFWIEGISHRIWDFDIGGQQQIKNWLNARKYGEDRKKNFIPRGLTQEEIEYFRLMISSIKRTLEIQDLKLDSIFEQIMEDLVEFNLEDLNKLMC